MNCLKNVLSPICDEMWQVNLDGSEMVKFD